MLKKNIGKTDKLIRLLLALVIAALFFENIISGVLALTLIAFSLLFIITSFFNFCPLYTLFGINTCPNKQKKELK